MHRHDTYTDAGCTGCILLAISAKRLAKSVPPGPTTLISEGRFYRLKACLICSRYVMPVTLISDNYICMRIQHKSFLTSYNISGSKLSHTRYHINMYSNSPYCRKQSTRKKYLPLPSLSVHRKPLMYWAQRPLSAVLVALRWSHWSMYYFRSNFARCFCVRLADFRRASWGAAST